MKFTHLLALAATAGLMLTGCNNGGGSRESIRAVADGRADFAVIDCMSWHLARQFEPASEDVHVAGWASSRPGLPLVTALSTGDDELERMRRAVMAAMQAVVLERPFLPTRLPDRRP